MAIWLVRHGETEWSISGQHTGSTDIPLTPEGGLQASAIGRFLAGRRFDHVFSSPMLRARETARLAGFGERIRVHEGLAEYDYGEFEGLTPGRSGRPTPAGGSSVTVARAARRPGRWPSVSTP